MVLQCHDRPGSPIYCSAVTRSWRGLPIADVVLALALWAASLVLLVWRPLPEEVAEGPAALNVLALSASTLPLAARRVRPLPAALVVVGALGVRALIAPPLETYPQILAVLIAGYSLGAYAPLRDTLIALPVTVASVLVAAARGSGGDATPDPLAAFVLLSIVWAVGRASQVRSTQAAAHLRRAEKLDADRERQAREAVLAERARIARELHDSVSHRLAVIRMQAGGARAVAATRPDQAERSLDTIERVAQEGLSEMRSMLELLDDDDGGPAERAPLPGLDRLDQLAADAESAGLRVDMQITGDPAGVPPAVALGGFRVVQEALTNAMRHAAGARVTVAVDAQEGCLAVAIADDGGRGTARPRQPGTGRGLAGLRERVGLLGGTFLAGPVDGGFSVRAEFPWDAAR
jgi:signal transduction histidine kinase